VICKGHTKLSVVRQCELLSLHRSGVYYQPKGESELNLKLMRLMDEHYLHHPFKSARRMHKWLKREGYEVNHKRIERLYYKIMGLRSVMPGKHTSRRCKEHKIYPYLLRNLPINKVNQVWATDITYIPMKKGFMYLTAIIDLHSRYVLNWSISNSMDSKWVSELMEQTIEEYGAPEIVNTDQGSQYSSDDFVAAIMNDKQHTQLSMDGRGRATDNAFIETLWKSIKYEKIYLNPPQDGLDLYKMVDDYFEYYNHHREHSSLNDRMPSDVFHQAA